jgi:hypothetical protein
MATRGLRAVAGPEVIAPPSGDTLGLTPGKSNPSDRLSIVEVRRSGWSSPIL